MQSDCAHFAKASREPPFHREIRCAELNATGYHRSGAWKRVWAVYFRLRADTMESVSGTRRD